MALTLTACNLLTQHHADPETEQMVKHERTFTGDFDEVVLLASLRAGTSTGNHQGAMNFDPTDPDNYDDMILNGSS
ncbi:hypothetical protein QSJ19_26035 [Gordonia sp. ABSL11-1]|uniref:hypothetical protein n=1 Tax=Gordonia sp. ABSL11-1 TaxID=3053924 RepID=UPI002573A6A8|nr:hypothetical protein [Gordonia sp. ABSL11-1]MDL9948977.1 hypothetical protein [Gordonia sp. ABSL11-1]